jgi:hypothetical protein
MSEPLLKELRAAKPAAPEELRERVRLIAAAVPAREPFLARLQRPRLRWNRLVLVAPAALLVAVAAAGVIGLTRGDGAGGDGQEASGETALSAGTRDASRNRATTEESLPALGAPQSGGAIAPSTGRLQRYEAELRLRVDDVEALSSATKRAQRIATSLGGHVASLQYDAPSEGVGAAQITLRVPTSRIQSAIAQLSELGTILGQRYGIEDLQPQADSLQAQIDEAQRQIARLRGQLENRRLGDEERATLQARLNDARRTLAELQESLKGTRTEGRLGTIFLSLTTERIEPARDEGIAALLVLVVLGPFLLLGLLIWYALRLHGRREEERLLAK